METTTTSILGPRLPSHAAPSVKVKLPTSGLLCNSRSTTFLRSLPRRKMQPGSARLRLGSRCAADDAIGTCPEPEGDRDTRTLRFREEINKFDTKYGDGAAMRALGANSRQDAMLQELEATLFRDEEEKLHTYVTEILSKPFIACDEVGELAEAVCLRAAVAVNLSIRVTANAHLRVDASSGMSPETFKQIIQTYVLAFLKTAEDACHRKVDMTVVISLIDALRGLAAISHILFEDALSVVNNIEDSSLYYRPGYDVEALNLELQSIIEELTTNLTTAPESEAYERLRPTLTLATVHVFDFVTLVNNLRKKALAHVQARGNYDDGRNK